jgi:XTP/dITP diphosphohydrolase
VSDPKSSVVTRIYLASTNPGKLREFREAALDRDIEVEVLPAIKKLPACVEDGDTFEANALKKALHYSQYTEAPVFADDSGLCVDSLEGAPGVRSARFAGPNADDESNNQKLLSELAKRPQAPRAAHYVCVIALAQQGRVLTVVEGRVEGLISEKPRGSGGFGYDPYFFYPRLGQTFAELSLGGKFTVSHRGQAFRQLLDYIQTHPRQLAACHPGRFR